MNRLFMASRFSGAPYLVERFWTQIPQVYDPSCVHLRAKRLRLILFKRNKLIFGHCVAMATDESLERDYDGAIVETEHRKTQHRTVR